MSILLTTVLLQAAANPNMLPIGPKGTIRPNVGVTNTRTGRPATVADIVREAKDYQFVFVGESHDKKSDHDFQAEVIAALSKSGRDVVVGFEMFTRPNQTSLAPLTLQKWTPTEFAEKSSWKTDWNMDFKLYQSIFEVVYANRLPMVALNIPRDWVRAISRGGVAAMTPVMNEAVPPLDLTNADHRSTFDSMMGGHSGSMDNTYAAMVMWDTAMADSALRAMRWRGKNAVMVIVAGLGHNLYNMGIGLRIRQQTENRYKVLNVIPVGTEKEVSRGVGDYIVGDKT